MYKTVINTANIGQTKHKNRHSHSVTGTLILVRRNKEYCFIKSNCVHLIKHILQWISTGTNAFSRLQQKHIGTHVLIYSCDVQHTAITHPKWL